MCYPHIPPQLRSERQLHPGWWEGVGRGEAAEGMAVFLVPPRWRGGQANAPEQLESGTQTLGAVWGGAVPTPQLWLALPGSPFAPSCLMERSARPLSPGK